LILVDSDVLIDAGRGVHDAVACINEVEQRDDPAVSVVSQMELIVGCRRKADLRVVERFLRRFHVIHLNERMSRTAIDLLHRYRLSHGLLLADALIAATALTEGIPLVSKNQRDYRFIAGLDLRPYPNPYAP
jgi:predicted nucleic acid-binding protein